MSIPRTQVAYGFKRGLKKIQRYDNWPVSRPASGEVLIEVKAAGLCQSDLHILYAQEKHVPEEFVMGHEIAGQIVEIGKEGVPSKYKLGLRVAVSIPIFCGTCLNCRGGSDNNCLNSEGAYGLNTNGGFQKYLLVKNLNGLIPIPNGVSYEQAAITSDARGRIMPVGLGRSKLFFKNYELARREIKVTFSFGGTSQEQEECMNWVAQGRIKPLSSVVSMSSLPEYMENLAKGKIKGRVVFEPSKL
ncbi:unnamed protein product [Debaryomyces fabryi]|nr:unnamed protein product [Debaryomyces fabryi]